MELDVPQRFHKQGYRKGVRVRDVKKNMKCNNCWKEMHIIGEFSGFVEWQSTKGTFRREPLCAKCSERIEKAIKREYNKKGK